MSAPFAYPSSPCRLLPALLVFASIFTSALAVAQETTGGIEGCVLDARGVPIPDVSVAVTGPSLQGARGCMTSARGTFVLLALPVGEYRVKLAHLARQTQVFEAVRVRLGQTTSLGDVHLVDAVLEQPEIVIKAERPPIDPRSTVIGGVLEARDYSSLPIERDYRSALFLLPQADLSYSGDPLNVAGATGSENRYYMDGIDGTDPASGLTGTGLPYNFVEQVELRTGGYMPEYRSALGSIVNAVTYSGGNDVKGQAFAFYTENRIGADPRYRYKAARGDYQNYDVGASAGGPIRKDRLWYYLAYNPNVTREDVEIPGLGMYLDHTIVHTFAAKLTWRANPKNTLVLTTVGDPTVRDGVATAAFGVSGAPVAVLNPEVMLTDIRSGRVSLAAEGRSLLTDHVLLRTSLSWTQFRDRNVPATERGRNEPLFIVDSTGTWSGGPQSSVDDRSDVTQASVAATWAKGRHEAKAGFEYRDLRSHVDESFHTLNARMDGLYADFQIQYKCDVGYRIPSAFVQDSWRLTDRLRLNGGVRWDGLYFIASDGSVAQTILDEWQPRAGVVWEPGEAGAQKLSASAGRYYQDPGTAPLTLYYNEGGLFRFTTYDHDPRLDPSGGTVELELPGHIQPRLSGLQGQYFDEATLGYERRIGRTARLGVGLMYRVLRQGLEDGIDPETNEAQFNNPGSGLLRGYPRMRREYTGLVLTWRQRSGERMSWLASYTLSRNRGNYMGLYNSDFGYTNMNVNGSFDVLPQLRYADGRLPNDRTHVFKISGSCDAGAGITLGATGGWESGTPLSEFGSFPGSLDPVLVSPRGTVGRTPALWDLSLRVGYLVRAGNSPLRPRVTADFMHIGNPRKAVTYDQLHYFTGNTDWVFSDPNPRYLVPTQYQPEFAVRLGAEVGF